MMTPLTLSNNMSVKFEVKKDRNISLIPLPVANGIITKGLLYPLNNETLTFGERIGTRNKATENEVQISFNSGDLLIYISHE